MENTPWATNLILAKAASETGGKSKIYCYIAVKAKVSPGQKAKLPETEEKLMDYINDKRQCVNLKLWCWQKKLKSRTSRPAVVGSQDSSQDTT
jgi:hypothetical protein